jgi:hypothetical protein
MYYILLLPPNSHAFSLGGGSSSAPACQPLGLVSRTVSATNGESSSSSSSNHAEPFMSLEGPSTAYFDPQCEGESCLLASEDDSTFASALTEHELRLTQLIDAFLFYIPILSPILAFFTYETVAAVSDDTIHFLAQNTWVAVDGGIYEAKMIAPAINGVVVPAITILFATLLSNTFTTLRQRQQDVRTAINTEAGELRVLSSMVDSFEPKSTQRQCRSYLLQYTSRLIAESQQGNEYQNLVAGDSEMNGFLTTLNGMTRSETPSIIVSESYAAVTRLNSERSQRISSLQSTFPALHFGILTALAISICLAFLMETNLDVLIFLNAIQLKILWTMLIGTFSALGVVCYDLGDPFRGSYQISKTVHQLYTIRDAVKASENM